MSGRSAAGERPAPRVDAHLHLTKWWPDLRRTGYRPDLDYTVNGAIRELDRNHVDFALAVQMFLAPSEEEALIEGRRNYEESRGRLLPVATVDPTHGEEGVAATLALLDQEPGVVGIKLYPGYRSFYPHDRRLEPVYEFAHHRRVPVLLHQGDTLEGRGLLKFARPIEIDEVAGRYRDVQFVLCHLGNPWIDEAVEIVYKNPNVYADTSGLLPPPTSPYLARAMTHVRLRLEEAIVSSGLVERFLYGSDWPLCDPGVASSLILRLDLDEGDRQAILGGNAVRLFRLKPGG